MSEEKAISFHSKHNLLPEQPYNTIAGLEIATILVEYAPEM